MFIFEKTDIPEVLKIKPKIYEDERGIFFESYKLSEFEKKGIFLKFVQENQSLSKSNIVRALHYQLNPKAQGKLVMVLKGAIFDVAVDIRRKSPTYGKWVGVVLSEQNKEMLWVPPGFAHGFQSLEDNTKVIYKTTEEYSPENERGIVWNDPDLDISWKNKEKVIVSEKDAKLPRLVDCDTTFDY